MKVAIRQNEVFIDYAKRFTDEEITNSPYNYTIHEVGEIPKDCSYSDFDIVGGAYVFNQTKYDNRINKPLYQKELSDLEQWFTYYDRQVQEYARCQRLGIAFLNDNDLSILQLDQLAEQKKARINDLRGILGV